MDPENTLSNLLSVYLLIKPSRVVSFLFCCRVLSLVGLQAQQYINYTLRCNFCTVVDPILK
jgi:hypothetical protein